MPAAHHELRLLLLGRGRQQRKIAHHGPQLGGGRGAVGRLHALVELVLAQPPGGEVLAQAPGGLFAVLV